MSDLNRPQPGNMPLLAMLGQGTVIYAIVLEICLSLGHYFSGGKWPHPSKYFIVAAVALIAAIYKTKLRKKYPKYKGSLAVLTTTQAIIITCMIVFWAFLFGWLMAGPPGPEFQPG